MAYIVNLTEGVNDFTKRVHVKDLFEQFGEVAACWLPPVGHRHAEFGYLKFKRLDAAEKAVRACQKGQVDLWGRSIMVEFRVGPTTNHDDHDFDARGSNLISSRDLFKAAMLKRQNTKRKRSSSSSSYSSAGKKPRRKQRPRREQRPRMELEDREERNERRGHRGPHRYSPRRENLDIPPSRSPSGAPRRRRRMHGEHREVDRRGARGGREGDRARGPMLAIQDEATTIPDASPPREKPPPLPQDHAGDERERLLQQERDRRKALREKQSKIDERRSPSPPRRAERPPLRREFGVRYCVKLGNLPIDMDKNELMQIGKAYGKVAFHDNWPDPKNGCTAGVLEYCERLDALKALDDLNDRTMDGWEKRITGTLQQKDG